ncbi:VOC family protein [Amycolatopsis oliviviridis]|uniref:Glyoxalase/bleomycin resistance protein/dioxygenase superfamily protein n=1 Tax=Amycolatopsis oliviviridis TaxID=1471590 RepID=A0ABQ3LXP8_9PSEU|nr:VOC family protein [Amycolatopsis oliviviridis]GHH26283.1 glyoxalase/bleomycin resistance protein/dioxygenase superfamily protein [Amycolatopsis oliviviridis]
MANPIPDGYNSVTPWIISRDTAGVIDFLKRAFDAVPMGDPVYVESGKIGHAEVRIGDSVVMLFDAQDDWIETPAYLRLYVEDSIETQRRAIDAGAKEVTKQTELFFGDRVGRVLDPFGNLWWIQTRLVDLDYPEMERRMNDPKFIEAMRYVSGTEIIPSR